MKLSWAANDSCDTWILTDTLPFHCAEGRGLGLGGRVGGKGSLYCIVSLLKCNWLEEESFSCSAMSDPLNMEVSQ